MFSRCWCPRFERSGSRMDRMGRLQEGLPGRYQRDPATADFLQACEAILLGTPDSESAGAEAVLGIEQLIDGVASYLAPGNDPPDASELRAPETFLAWLGCWLAFPMRADLP